MNTQHIGYGYVSANALSYSISQFCDGHHISRSHLYELIKQGKGPRLMKVGRRTLISAEAAADWRRAMEAATGALAQESLAARV
jgi:hypothetical protein